MGLERMGTHSESCYKWHLECAVSRYEALRARVAGYEADIETKVRLIQDLCAMQKEHEDRILAQGARVAEAVRMIEGYKRAGWLTNPAAAEQATDFINRASGNESLQRIEVPK